MTELTEVNALKRGMRGTYRVETSDAVFWLSLTGSVAAGVDGVISNHPRLGGAKASGTIGGCGCPNDSPVIRIGRPICLVRPTLQKPRPHIIGTGVVTGIWRATLAEMESHICRLCGSYTEPGARCASCNYNPRSP